MDCKRIQLVSFTTFVTTNLYMENLSLIVEVERSMKKTIVFGSLLAAFLMLMIPDVSAIEYQTATDANKSYVIEKLNIAENDLSEIIESFKKDKLEKIKNIDYNFWEIINILFNSFAIIANMIWMFTNPDSAVLHFIYLTVHIRILIDWITSD